MPRHLRITVLLLVAWALLIVFFLPGMRNSLARIAQFGGGRSEEQVRLEVTRGAETAAAARTRVKLFWANAARDGLSETELDLALSADPGERGKQLIEALILRAPAEARILPADAAVLEFYVLPDGTAIVDFSAAAGTSLPSGILSEQMAIGAVLSTLAANVAQIERLKILIQGQEAETLAGHVDLTGYFPVNIAGGVLRVGPPPVKPEASGARSAREK